MSNFSETVRQKSNTELLTMVYQFDQWSSEMLEAVEAELSARAILPADLRDKRQALIEAEDARLSAGREAGPAGLIVGWLTVFGLAGIGIGYNYAFSKIRNKYSGKAYFKYNESSRARGRFLFYMSIFLSLGAILIRIFFPGKE